MFSVLLLLSSSLFAFSLSLFLSTFSLTGHDLAVREVAREEVVVGGHVLFFLVFKFFGVFQPRSFRTALQLLSFFSLHFF